MSLPPAGRAAALIALGHVLLVAWLFGDVLLGSQVLFFRDLSLVYHPNLVFLGRALREGVWPLWMPLAEGGTPFLQAFYPVDVLLAAAFGGERALGLTVPLHLFLALAGASALARSRGASPLAAWLGGVVYGLTGFVLSTVNLLQLFEAAAWAPWVILAATRPRESSTFRPDPVASALLAVQVSTLAGEIVLQTMAVIAVLAWAEARASGLRHLPGTAALAGMLAAPAITGAAWLSMGTARATGLDPTVALAYSAHPLQLVEMLVPRLFGDVHCLSDDRYWYQVFAPDSPYLLSLYVGLPALLLVARCRSRAPFVLIAAGLVLALGTHGPASPLLWPWALLFRGPVKFAFLAVIGLSLAAAEGLDRAREQRSSRPWDLIPGALLVLAGLSAASLPAGVLPANVTRLAHEEWPTAFMVSGALAVGVALGLYAGKRLAGAAAASLVVFDLLIVNAGLNPTAPAAFYHLRPAIAVWVEEGAREGPFRWLSFGLGGAGAIRWAPAIVRQDADVWLHYVDRQALVPRSPALDGIETAFELPRTGFERPPSILYLEDVQPHRIAGAAPRLRAANVRWVLSFDALPGPDFHPRGEVQFPELAQPLRRYELEGVTPRVRYEAVDGASGQVRMERPDAHTIDLLVDGGPGRIVLVEALHRGWVAERDGEATPMSAPDAYSVSLETPGGPRRFQLRYEPPWPRWGLGATMAGIVLSGLLVLWRTRGSGVTNCQGRRISVEALDPTRDPAD